VKVTVVQTTQFCFWSCFLFTYGQTSSFLCFLFGCYYVQIALLSSYLSIIFQAKLSCNYGKKFSTYEGICFPNVLFLIGASWSDCHKLSDLWSGFPCVPLLLNARPFCTPWLSSHKVHILVTYFALRWSSCICKIFVKVGHEIVVKRVTWIDLRILIGFDNCIQWSFFGLMFHLPGICH